MLVAGGDPFTMRERYRGRLQRQLILRHTPSESGSLAHARSSDLLGVTQMAPYGCDQRKHSNAAQPK